MGSVLGPDEGRILTLGAGLQLCFKVDDAETDGRCSVSVVDVAAKDAGTTPHVHREHDELFFVLAGTPSFEIEAETHETLAGSFVLVSRGRRHFFKPKSKWPTRSFAHSQSQPPLGHYFFAPRPAASLLP